MRKAILLVFLLVISCAVFAACDSEKEPVISLNGNVEEKLQVHAEFYDKGVTVPEGYTVVTEGYVLNNILGRYHITYSVYSNNGEFIKELNRFVDVVDEIPPTFKEKAVDELYAGVVYQAKTFFSEYKDDSNSIVSFDPQELSFRTPGTHVVSIVLSDKSGNSVTFEKEIHVVLDFPTLLQEVYKDQPSKVSTGTTGIGSDYVNVRINSEKSIAYYSTGSLHYLEKIQTHLGSYASIQISANYGCFDDASISFHISGQNTDAYSVGFAYFDATREYDVLTIQSFQSTINNLNLDESEMLAELNANLLSVLNNFKEYINTVLNIEFK